MQANYIQKGVKSGEERLEIYGSPFGATKGSTHQEQAVAVGSNIPAGLFVSYSPDFVMGGECATRAVILPDLAGTSLYHNDRSTDFSADIANVLVDGLFKFVGVSMYAGDECPPMCAENQCCPFGYPDDGPQHNNYWTRLDTAQIATQGPVNVYNTTDIGLLDELHVVVAQIDGEPCRYIGSVTNVADDGTQPLDIDYRITQAGDANCGVWLELGRK